MKIDTIKINGFGKLTDQEIELKDGINLVYGENETGKSTILKCIQAMFFGLSKLKNGKNISDFDQYKPWRNSEFSAKMKYTLDNDETYEIFRDFKKKNPIIYNQFQEDISKNFKQDKSKGIRILEEQIGIDETTFKNTAMIGQQEIKLQRADTNIMIQKISNLVSTGDDNISFKKSIEKLSKMQNDNIGTERTRQKPINIVNEKIRQLLEQKRNLSFYKQTQIQQEQEKENLKNRLNQLFQKKTNLKENQESSENTKIENTKKKINITICLFIFFIIVAFILFSIVKNIVVNVIAVIPIIISGIFIKRKSDLQMEALKNTNQRISQNYEVEQEKIQNEINQTNAQLHILEIEKNNIDEKLEELARIEEKLEEQNAIKEELMSLDISFEIAKEALENAYEKIKHNISPKFEQNLCEIISNITNAKYENVKVNDEVGLLVEIENGEYMPAERLSIGTIDEMYLSLRLSTLGEISQENLPIILDETFAYFDNHRLKNILHYLQDKKYNHQIIIFTCSNREEEILKQLKIEYHQVVL